MILNCFLNFWLKLVLTWKIQENLQISLPKLILQIYICKKNIAVHKHPAPINQLKIRISHYLKWFFCQEHKQWELIWMDEYLQSMINHFTWLHELSYSEKQNLNPNLNPGHMWKNLKYARVWHASKQRVADNIY